MLLIERENPITRLNRSNRGASELRVAGGCVVAGSGMRAPHYSTAEHGIALVYWQRHGSDSRLWLRHPPDWGAARGVSLRAAQACLYTPSLSASGFTIPFKSCYMTVNKILSILTLSQSKFNEWVHCGTSDSFQNFIGSKETMESGLPTRPWMRHSADVESSLSSEGVKYCVTWWPCYPRSIS